MAAHYFPGSTISKRYTTLRDATCFPMKVRKTLAVGIAAASISAGVAAPAQGEATTPQTAQVAQAARTEGTPSPHVVTL